MDVRQASTPNFDARPLEVEFLVIHYTAGNLERTLELFGDPVRQVSAHLVINTDGRVYELVTCLDGTAQRAWHAGESRWFDGRRTWEAFNDFSIGIELVNLNGQLFSYPQAQYRALFEVVHHLQMRYPTLQQAERVVGHEHIAGWRGKADPGFYFNWTYFFENCYPNQPQPERKTVCPAYLKTALEKFLPFVPEDIAKAKLFWEALSFMTETGVRLIQ